MLYTDTKKKHKSIHSSLIHFVQNLKMMSGSLMYDSELTKVYKYVYKIN